MAPQIPPPIMPAIMTSGIKMIRGVSGMTRATTVESNAPAMIWPLASNIDHAGPESNGDADAYEQEWCCSHSGNSQPIAGAKGTFENGARAADRVLAKSKNHDRAKHKCK